MAIRIESISMARNGPREFQVVEISAVFDNDRYQKVTLSPSLSPAAVADALEALAWNIRADKNLRG